MSQININLKGIMYDKSINMQTDLRPDNKYLLLYLLEITPKQSKDNILLGLDNTEVEYCSGQIISICPTIDSEIYNLGDIVIFKTTWEVLKFNEKINGKNVKLVMVKVENILGHIIKK